MRCFETDSFDHSTEGLLAEKARLSIEAIQGIENQFRRESELAAVGWYRQPGTETAEMIQSLSGQGPQGREGWMKEKCVESEEINTTITHALRALRGLNCRSRPRTLQS